MAAGVAGLFLTLAAVFAGDVVGIDSLLREFRWASKVEYDKVQPDGRIKKDNQHNALSILPPSAHWGLVRLPIDARTDKLVITDLVDDAHITCIPMDGGTTWRRPRRRRCSGSWNRTSSACSAGRASAPRAGPSRRRRRSRTRTTCSSMCGWAGSSGRS